MKLVRPVLVAFAVLVIGATATACRPKVEPAPVAYPPPPDYVVSTVNAHFGDLGPYVVSCMFSIAARESGYVAEAIGGAGGNYRGLFQISWSSDVWDNMNANWGFQPGWTRFFWQDPWIQAGLARSMYEGWVQRGGSGFTPWAATRGGCR